MVTTSLPRIDRETTTRVTVTATSPALGEVADRQRALETALGDGDASAVVIASARLRVALNALTSSEWLPIRAEIEDLLARTDDLPRRPRRQRRRDAWRTVDSVFDDAARSALVAAPADHLGARAGNVSGGTAADGVSVNPANGRNLRNRDCLRRRGCRRWDRRR